MVGQLKKCLGNKKIRISIKLTVSFFIMFFVLRAFFLDGTNPYHTVKEYPYQNDFIVDQVHMISDTTVSQHFIARGNVISNISLYLDSADSGVVDISLSDTDGKLLRSISVDLDSYPLNAWNNIAFDCKKIKRGSEYILNIRSEQGLSSLFIDIGEKPETYTRCETGQGDIKGSLVVGIQQTYHYVTWASMLELLFRLFVITLLSLALCYTVLHIERLWKGFIASEKKKGSSYAIYFAVTLALSFDPTDIACTELKSFKRVIGPGLIANIDVSRRINNFFYWFILFGVAIMLYYMLIDHMKRKDHSGEKKKVVDFLDQLMILGNVDLLHRCITYFDDQAKMQTVFYYSTSMIQLFIIIASVYLIFDLDKKVPLGLYLRSEMIAFCVAYPIAIISQKEWQSGRLLFGIQAVAMIAIIPVVYHLAGFIRSEKCAALITSGAICTAMIPFVTSFYIEFINILAQHGLFVTHLRRYYATGMLMGSFVTLLLSIYIRKKGIRSVKWKRWSYLWLVFGIACLNAQIPLENSYSADVFETANSSILISDLLNFGDIPIVQHYGGHMMSGVWEGIIYAVLNNDYAGAIFSPYSGYLMTVLAVLFFALVRKIWDEDIALCVTLFFPFYNVWRYYGLGMLVCLAVWAYIKKNTYPRAMLVWSTFVWCTIYRLDLGFSIGFAYVAAMIIYVLTDKNWKVAKQLSITLVAWAVIGGALWFILCFVKEIDPVDRLLEFLLISLSNQNWAYRDIGNTENTLFSWCYIVIPFAMIGSLLYAIFSKKFREDAGDEKWVLLLILGIAYFANFPRGLVRHSLAETATTIVLWDAYIYIAIFLSTYKKKKEWFLPLFALLIMCDTFFTTTANYNTSAIADIAASKVGDFTRTWTLGEFAYEDLTGEESIPQTYWTRLKKDGEKITRVEWDETLKNTLMPYGLVVDTLLKKDETFVDLTNKTFVYSGLNRKVPMYVSQSPAQLSGELTQKMFIKEMKGIPIILIPLRNDRYSIYLDGIANTYRYYKVVEYIYRNYVPLCRYDSLFAVWCLSERYEEFRKEAGSLVNETDHTRNFMTSDQMRFLDCERREDNVSKDVMLVANGADPRVDGLQDLMDLTPYIGKSARITVRYDTDIDGKMQMFYTTGEKEDYTGEKVITVNISGEGIARFIVPVTEYTKLRLDIPEASTVMIRSLTVSYPVSYVAPGYDGPDSSMDENGNITYSYGNGLHTYRIGYLPSIWAENDDAINNTMCCRLKDQNGIFTFEPDQIMLDEDGNYLHVAANYIGNDTGTAYDVDDETIDATIKIGIYTDGEFREKYQYDLIVKEGRNDYLIRISNDYNWYLGEMNAVKIFSDGTICDITMDILKGD